MLERLLLKHLTKKGTIGYFIGIVILFALLAYYFFGIAEYSLDDDRTTFFIALLIINLLWAGVCLLLWKKPKEEKNEEVKSNVS